MTVTDPNPYVGPRPFALGEQLYGRQREELDLLDLLIAERIVLVYSPSGAGKTSLLQAALIPRLEKEGFRVLPVIRVNGDPPVGIACNRYLASAMRSIDDAAVTDESLEKQNWYQFLNQLPQTSGKQTNHVLIFDQFEEILTVDPTNRAAKEEFFEAVGAALRDRKWWALFSMREDYLASLD